MVEWGWSLWELPLRGLGCEVDIIVLARILIQMGNPSLGHRRRRGRANSTGEWRRVRKLLN